MAQKKKSSAKKSPKARAAQPRAKKAPAAKKAASKPAKKPAKASASGPDVVYSDVRRSLSSKLLGRLLG